MKITNSIIALLFASFAIVQYNDPDPWLWMLFYAFAALLSLMAVFGQFNKWLLLAGILASLLWMATLVPGVIDWFQKGMPSIAGSMKAESPHIEWMREFLGLFLVLLNFLFIRYQFTKQKT